MTPRLPHFSGLLCAFCLASAGVWAAADDPDLATRFNRYTVEYRINGDGSFVENREWAKTILKEKAVAGNKQASINYSTSIQQADVVAAYTLKAGGRRVDAPKSNFQVETNSGKGKDAPIFSDWTALTVVFPEVEVGDTVVFAYRLTAKEPIYPGQFSVQEYFPRERAFDDVSIRIDAPAALWLQVAARQLTEVRKVEQDGRRIVEWSYQNRNPLKSKRRDFSAYDAEKEPGFAVSTFRDYAAVAEAYGVRARPKAVPNERVRQLADEVAKGRVAPRDVARTLYDWVAVNISYAGHCIGLGAVVPHDTDFILDNRMGDCKDHATLLQALLAAKGIASAQALVNAGSSYRLPKVPVVSTVNHVINYIPALDLYLDPTSNSTPFGMLPMSDADKPVLLVDGYRDGARTPAAAPGSNRQVMKTRIEVQPDGSVRGDVQVSYQGRFAADARYRMRNLDKSQEDELVRNVFKNMGYVGAGTFDKDDPKGLLDTYRYGAKFEVKNLLQYPGAGAFPIAPVFFSEAPINGYVFGALQGDEEADEFACSNGTAVEEYTYVFPKGMKILSIPDDARLANELLSYHASYKLKGNTLTVKRSYDDRTKGNLCGVEIANLYRDFARKVLPNIKAQVLYK